MVAMAADAFRADPGGAESLYGDMVDWDLAVTTAKRLARPSPEIDRDEARQVVEELRRGAAASEDHVRAYTGMEAASATAPVLVVDRAGWVQANADGFRELLRPLVDEDAREARGPAGMTAAIGSRVTGLEAGGLLGVPVQQGARPVRPVLQRADSPGRPAARRPDAAGGAQRRARRARAATSTPATSGCGCACTRRPTGCSSRRCPWLREHILGEMSGLLESAELDPAKMAATVRDGIERVGRAVKGDESVSLLDVLQTPEQKAAVERLTAVMSLLEGHADVVMDGVGPSGHPVRRRTSGRSSPRAAQVPARSTR